MFPVLSQIPGISDFLPCPRMVRVASVVGIAMTTTCTIVAWCHLDMSVVEIVTLESLVLEWVTQTQAIIEYNS